MAFRSPRRVRVWLRVAALSFGGPAGQIAVMHRILVDEKRWIGEARFLHALNFCMLLPGPEAQQLAIYLGWLLHRTWGGVVAGVLFVLPGFLAILALSLIYVTYGDVGAGRGRLLRAEGGGARDRAAGGGAHRRRGRCAAGRAIALAAAAFVAIFVFGVPVPADRASAAGLIGYVASRRRLGSLPRRRPRRHGRAGSRATPTRCSEPALPAHARGPARSGSRRSASCSGSPRWPSLVLLLGPDQVFTRLALFFSQMAVVTFGGAYAVLAYVAQAAAETYGWVTPGRDARRPRHGRDDARAADHGGAVRRLPRGLPRPGRARSLPGGGARVGAGDLGDLRPVLPLDLPRRALHRAAARATARSPARSPPSPRRWSGSSSTSRSGSGCTCSSASSSRCVHSASGPRRARALEHRPRVTGALPRGNGCHVSLPCWRPTAPRGGRAPRMPVGGVGPLGRSSGRTGTICPTRSSQAGNLL